MLDPLFNNRPERFRDLRRALATATAVAEELALHSSTAAEAKALAIRLAQIRSELDQLEDNLSASDPVQQLGPDWTHIAAWREVRHLAEDRRRPKSS